MERRQAGNQEEQEESGAPAAADPCPSSPSSATSSEGGACSSSSSFALCPPGEPPNKAPAAAAAAALLLGRRHSKKRFGLKLFGRSRKAIAKSGLQHMVTQPIPTLALRSDSEREIRSTVDWSEGAIYGEHIWFETNVSGDFCYVGEQNCVAKMLQKPLSKRKCAACKIVVHTPCIEQLEKINFRCKPSFRESGSRNIREPTIVRHHWVHRRRQEGKCRQCGKGFQQKFAFHSKEIVAISCSWCKQAYHSKVSCFMLQHIEEPCSLGAHAAVVIPPTWILRVRHPQNPLKSSKKKKRTSFKRKSSKKGPEVRDCIRVGGGLRFRRVSGTKQKVGVEKDRESMRTCESCFGRI